MTKNATQFKKQGRRKPNNQNPASRQSFKALQDKIADLEQENACLRNQYTAEHQLRTELDELVDEERKLREDIIKSRETLKDMYIKDEFRFRKTRACLIVATVILGVAFVLAFVGLCIATKKLGLQ
ncbi:hypothetical protein IKW75_01120 [Candidatus Saccharibacteria bacterium]|nr:hypothetical protein [Candidatus Saccharibacteria bacterium]